MNISVRAVKCTFAASALTGVSCTVFQKFVGLFAINSSCNLAGETWKNLLHCKLFYHPLQHFLLLNWKKYTAANICCPSGKRPYSKTLQTLLQMFSLFSLAFIITVSSQFCFSVFFFLWGLGTCHDQAEATQHPLRWRLIQSNNVAHQESFLFVPDNRQIHFCRLNFWHMHKTEGDGSSTCSLHSSTGHVILYTFTVSD